jgi:hypothetical protein
MSGPALPDPAIPARLPHVTERHPQVEALRPVMLTIASNMRISAAALETALCEAPDNDAAIAHWGRTLAKELRDIDLAISKYREIRGIQGTA